MTKPGVLLGSTDEQDALSQYKLPELRISMPSRNPTKPCPDLLHGSRKDYITTGIPLYEASIKGDWKTAKEILDKRPELVTYCLAENGDTALHIAVSAKSTKKAEDFVENLMSYMEMIDLKLENNDYNTPLWLAAAAGNLKMIKIMVNKDEDLLELPTDDTNIDTPLFVAALFGHYEVVNYLYDNSGRMYGRDWTFRKRSWVLLKCVESDMFDIAVNIVIHHPDLGTGGKVLLALAEKADVFNRTESNIIMRALNCVIRPKKLALEKESKVKALELLTLVWQKTAEKPKEEFDRILRGPPDTVKKDNKSASDKDDQHLQLLKQMSDNIVQMHKSLGSLPPENVKVSDIPLSNYVEKKYSSQVMFVAVEKGNTRFIVELIRQYPDLVSKVNDDNQSIFHMAARHRQVDIYNLLHEIGSYKDMITRLVDTNDNSMLHLVARSVDRKRLEDVSGGAFQMQHELLWFKEVEEKIPHAYRQQRNKDGLTARDLFTKEHKDLVLKGEEWMKGTSSQCMVVATLIATIVFAAAFTVPGGYSQDKGIPFFLQDTSFLIFVVADAISLFSSSASILTFLSFLTSGYAENDFLRSLLRKLMLGVATLYISITTMMIAFSVSFFVLYSKNLKWIPIIVTLIATMPVLLFGALQYRLLKDVISSTYGSRYLFRPKKRVLYPEHSNSNHRFFPFFIPCISRCTSKLLKLL